MLAIAYAPGLASAAGSPAAPHDGARFALPPTAHASLAPSPAGRSLPPPIAPTGRVVFNAPGPRPGAWAQSGVPPGAEALATLGTGSSAAGSWGSGGGSAATWQNRFCTGVWPSFSTPGAGNPQSVYAAGCYGHDEPGIEFYSTLPGSGGNVTWNFSLPLDRNATLNQSNNYVAIWLGMALNDPYAWMDQAFLELQFYPDQTFYNPGPLYPNLTVNGAWIAAAVVWQIQASTGAENPAFYEPMYLGGTPGPAFLNMTQGDQILTTMTGWGTSPTGEQISVWDQSNGQRSNLTLFNASGNYPLDPSYVANNFENGLEWTPGGEYPVSMAFETGHSSNGDWPENNSYGGCSPGLKSTPNDPAAPCPSYDPGSWANDTLRPWKVQVPTFFEANTTASAAQVGFTQDFGGISLESQLSGGACNGLAGSAWCSYPWWSYSCRDRAFNFGATDYSGVTSDFGKYNEYAPAIQANAIGFGFYAPTNFSIPTCGAPAYSVTVAASGGGSAYFLSHGYSTASTVGAVGPGEYALNAINSVAGARFDHWTTTGAVAVGASTSAYTSLTVSGNGNVTAVFSSTPRTTLVTFLASPSGSFGLDPGLTYQGPANGNGNPIGTFANGSSVSLSPGIYSLQAYPAAGYNFTAWSTNNSGAAVAASAYPYTWLVVTGSSAGVGVRATFTPTSAKAIAEVEVVGNGTVQVGTLKVVDSGTPYAIGLAHPRVGTWRLTATPGIGNDRVQIFYGPSGVMSNFSTDTLITLEQGLTFVEAVFSDNVSVGFASATPTEGAVSLLGPVHGPGTNFSVGLPTGNYTIAADPFSGDAFGSWGSTGGITIWSPSSIVTEITVTGTGLAVASFGPANSTTVHLGAQPAKGGSELFDGLTTLSAGVRNGSVGLGPHWATATPTPGWVFAGWNTTGGVTIVGASTANAQEFDVTGSGRLVAVFAPGVFPVTFVAWKPSSGRVPGAILTIGGATLTTGETAFLAAGSYHATISTGAVNVEHWTATSNLTLHHGSPAGVTIVVIGSGTVYALLGIPHNGTGSGSGGIAGGPVRSLTTPPVTPPPELSGLAARLAQLGETGRE